MLAAVQYAGGERLLTEGDDTRGCGDTIDEQRAARNMLRSVV